MTVLLLSNALTSARAQSPPPWRLDLVHAIRPSDQSTGSLGNVIGIAVLPDGSVYVAESDPAHITLYGSDGNFMRTMMGNGEGPGETRFPEISVRGDTLIAYDPHLGRLTRMAPDGRLLDERRIDIGAEGRIWTTNDGRILLDLVNARGPWDGNALRLAPNGHVDTVRWQHPPAEDLVIQWNGPGWDLRGRSPFSPRGIATFDPAGRLVIGGSKRSRWVVVSGVDTVQTVTVPDREIPIAKQVRDSVWTAWYAQLIPKKDKLPHLDEVVREDRIPTALPPWVTFDVDRNGMWWIGRPGADGVLASWDVISNGSLVGHAVVPTRIVDGRLLSPIMNFGKSYVALLHEDRNGAPWIGVYRVVRSIH
jgi:hypothetical protein